MTPAQRTLTFTLLGGLLSAILGSLVSIYPFPGAAVLSYFSLLPLFLIGLGLGLSALYGASLIAAALPFLVDPPLVALQSFISVALGPVFLVNRALLHRKTSSGEISWYPGSELLKMFNFALGACLLGAFGVYFYTTQGEPPEVYIHGLLEAVDPQHQMQELEPVLVAAFPFLPGIIVISWGIMVLINGSLAQGILGRFRQNLRPAPSLEDLHLPKLFSLVFAGCLLLSFMGIGYVDVLVKNVLCVSALSFFLVGLGVVHRWIRKTSYGTIALTLFYLLLIFFWPILIVIGIGMLKPWMEKLYLN